MISVLTEQIVRAHVTHIVHTKHRSLTHLVLETNIHLHRARSLKVGREDSLLAAQQLAEKIRIRRSRSERCVCRLELCLQVRNRVCYASHGPSTDACRGLQHIAWKN